VPRRAVGLALGCSTAVFACSTGTAPDLTSTAGFARSQASAILPPYAPGAHVAALPGLAGNSVFPMAINDFGEVVGYIEGGAAGLPSAFKYQTTRGLHTLTLPGGQPSFATSVNDRGQVGITVDVDSGQRAAIWSWFGDVTISKLLSTWVAPNPAGFPSCQLTGIGENGATVGTCTVGATLTSLATVWTASGTPDVLAPSGGASRITGDATAIGRTGYIIGNDSIASAGFLFGPGDHERLLPPLGASKAAAVNDSGWVAGTVFISAAVGSHAAAWMRGDTVIDLNIVGEAKGISEDGIVAGTSLDPRYPHEFAFVWTAANGLERLPPLEGGSAGANETTMVIAMNHQHQVLGQVETATGLQTVVWTIIPSTTSVPPPL
jgi:hypothetical protein